MTRGVNKKFPSLTDPKFGKPVRVLVWINGEFDREHDVKLDSSDLRSWAGVLSFLTVTLKPHFGAIRKLYHSATRTLVTCLADIRSGERYVAVGREKIRFKKHGYVTAQEQQKIRSKSRSSLDEHVPSMLNFMDYTKKKKRTVIYVMVSGRTCQDPLKVVLTRDDFKAYDTVLKFLGNQLDIEEGVQYLANVKGRIVFRPEELRHGNIYVAVPFNGRFVKMDYNQLFGKLRPDKVIRLRKPKMNRSALVEKKKSKPQSKNLSKSLVGLKSQSDNQIHTATSESGIAVQTDSRSVEKSLPTFKSHSDSNEIHNSTSQSETVQTGRNSSNLYQKDGTDSTSIEKSLPTIKSHSDSQIHHSTSQSETAVNTGRKSSHLSQQDDTDGRSVEKSFPTIKSHSDNQIHQSTSQSKTAVQTGRTISHISQQDGTFSKHSHRNDDTDGGSIEQSLLTIISANDNQIRNSESQSETALQIGQHMRQLSQKSGTVSKQSLRKDDTDSQSVEKSLPTITNATSQSKIAEHTDRNVSQLSRKSGTVSKQSLRKDDTDSQSVEKSLPTITNAISQSKIAENIGRNASKLSQKSATVSKQSLRKDGTGSDNHNATSRTGTAVRNVSHLSKKDGSGSKQSTSRDSSDSGSSNKDGSIGKSQLIVTFSNESLAKNDSDGQSPKREGSASQFLKKISIEQDKLEADQTYLREHDDEESTNKLVTGIVQSLLSHATEHTEQKNINSSHLEKPSISLSDKVFFPTDDEKKIITSHPDMVIYPGDSSKEKVMTSFAEIAKNKKLEKMGNTSQARDSVTISEVSDGCKSVTFLQCQTGVFCKEVVFKESDSIILPDQANLHLGSIPKQSILKMKAIVDSLTLVKSYLVPDKEEAAELNTTSNCETLHKPPSMSQTTQDIIEETSLNRSQADGPAAMNLNSTSTQKNLEDSGDNDKSVQTFKGHGLSERSKSQQAANNISKNGRSGNNVQNLKQSNTKEIYYAPARPLSDISEKNESDSDIKLDDRLHESGIESIYNNSMTQHDKRISNNNEQQISDCCYAVSDGESSADEIKRTNQKELQNNNKSRSQTLTRNISQSEKDTQNNGKRLNSEINELTKNNSSDNSKNQDVRRNNSKYLNKTNNNKHTINDTEQNMDDSYCGGGIDPNELKTECGKKNMGREILKLEILQELRDTLDHEIRRKTDLTGLSGAQHGNINCSARCLRENYDTFACSDIHIKRYCGRK